MAAKPKPLFPLPPTDMPGPYLERLSAIHLPDDKGPSNETEEWRKLVIQPAVIPDLQHTGVRSDFTYQGDTFMRPDGAVTSELRSSIQTKFSEIPKAPLVDPQDMKQVDIMRSVRRGGALRATASSLLADLHRPENGPGARAHAHEPPLQLTSAESVADQTEAVDSIISEESSIDTNTTHATLKRKKRKKRKKKPYSNASLFSAMLDLEYGNTDAATVGDTDQDFKWDIREYKKFMK